MDAQIWYQRSTFISESISSY
uniref:Uncharacterized protein n=1 Tax=Arundo donax TaxID=35708 RepID=A0A0A8Y1Z1_ARUDO